MLSATSQRPCTSKGVAAESLVSTARPLQAQHDHTAAMRQQSDDARFQLEEKLRKVDMAHTQILQDAMNAYDR